MKSRFVIGIVAAALGPAAASSAESRKELSRAPNELTCKMVAMTGSRLARRQVCVTRSWYENHRTSQRRVLEQAQVNRQSP